MRIWERQDGETSRSFAAFGTFRDLGATRTLREAAGLFYGTEGGATDAQYQQFKLWSRTHDWAERVRSFDSWLDLERRAAIEQHLNERAEDFARRETRLREQALEAREKAMTKALRMLDWPIAEQRRLEEGPDGDNTYIFEPTRWTLSTAVNLYQMSQGGGPSEEDLEKIAEPDYSGLDDEEFENLVQTMEKVVWRTPER